MPLRKIGDVELLELQGTPDEMGTEHGRLLKKGIQMLIERYVRRSERIFEVPYDYLVREAQRCKPFIPDSYILEMEAIASASEVPFDELLAMNCIADVDGCYMQQILRCCNFVVGPPATTDRLFLHGRNLDFPPGGNLLPRTAAIVSRQPASADTLPTLAIGWAGFVGMFTGFSAAQITAAEISVPAQDSSVEGVPISCLIRYGLEHSSSVADFAQIVKSTPRTCGYNLAVSDGKTQTSCGIELTHLLCERRGPQNGILVVDDVCLCKRTGSSRLSYPAGAFRHARMMELIDGHRGQIDTDLALTFLKDRYDMAYANPQGRGYNCICNSHTVQSVLFFPAEKRLLISNARVPAPNGEYRELRTESLW